MPQLRVPHHHILLPDGRAVWTYVGNNADYLTRRRTRCLLRAGHRPVIVSCRIAGRCHLYGPTPDTLSEEVPHARTADRESHAS